MPTVISRVHLENFRSFRRPTTINLKPLTLLFGQNSAGKSSIIKALLFLQQSLDSPSRSQSPGAGFIFSGTAVDLGSFAATVSQHDTNQPIRVGVTAQTIGRDGQIDKTVSTIWGLRSADKSRHLEVDLEVVAGDQSLHFTRHPTAAQFVLSPTSVDAWLTLARGTANLFSDDNGFEEELESGRGSAPIFKGTHFPERLRLELLPPNLLDTWKQQDVAASRAQASDSTEPSLRSNPLLERWDDFASEFWQPMRHQLRGVIHIGPLRREPQRFERYIPTELNEVGSAGQHTLALMNERPPLLRQVNDYLQLLQLPFRIRVKSLGSSQTVGDIISLMLVNPDTRLEVSPSDVGVGYSQVLPLITQCAISRARLVCVEQPELHLHPAMQARLADVFITESNGGNRTRFLIETHSENLMLRVLRRIREGQLSPDDVAVLYVDQDDNGDSIVHEIPIDGNGDFAAEWPKGFFDERLEELGW